jgi:copper chaperone CopZ/predicted peroxiredoxin
MTKIASHVAIGILGLLAGALLVGPVYLAAADGRADDARRADASARVFAIEGMHCQGCVDAVTAALRQIPGVQSAKVSLESKQAVVEAKPSDVPAETILTAIAAAGYKGQPAAEAQSSATAQKLPILVNITRGKDQLHAVAMAIALAQSAIKDGRSATIFLNVDAPVFASKESAASLTCAGFPPLKKMLTDFMAAGGRVLVCEHCAHLAKIVPHDMIDGAKAVTQSELFASLAPGTVVFSY